MITDLVSILTPCYNGARFLAAYFGSILQQTYKNYEVIFVDDGSTDETAEIAHRYGKLICEAGGGFRYLYQENSGQAAAINKGLPFVTGEFLVWPDCDDRLAPESLEKRVEFLKHHKEYAVVATGAQYFDERDLTTSVESKFWEEQKENLFEAVLIGKVVHFSAVYMLRTNVLFKALPMQKIIESPVGQNWQILLPVLYHSKCGYLNECLSYITICHDSHSRSIDTLQKWKKRFISEKILIFQILDALDMDNQERQRLKEKFVYFCDIRWFMRQMAAGGEKENNLEQLRNYIGEAAVEYLTYDKKLWIYGASDIGKNLGIFLEKLGYIVSGFIDSDSKKVSQGTYAGKSVISFQQYEGKDAYLLIPLRCHKSIVESLRESHMISDVDYVYPYYRMEKM